MDTALSAVPQVDESVVADFREVMGQFASGITVITAQADTGPVGFTCQSFASLSLLPPLVLFCPSRTSSSWQAIRQVGRFTINVLEESQQQLSNAFARSGGDKFAGVEWTAGATGAPRLSGALAHIDAEIEQVVDGGDHEIAIGRVHETARRRTGRPLLYFRSAYQTMAW